MWGPIQNFGTIGSAILTFIGYKQKNKQRNEQRNKQTLKQTNKQTPKQANYTYIDV